MAEPMKRKPRYSPDQKAANRKAVEKIVNKNEGWVPIWRTRIHVTLRFDNGRTIECYPTVIGLHYQSHWLEYHRSAASLLKRLKQIAGWPKVEKPAAQKDDDDIDLLEDFDGE